MTGHTREIGGIIPKKSAVPGKVPTGTTGSETNLLKFGEIASNLSDRKLWGFDGTNVFEYGSSSYLGLSGGTVSGTTDFNDLSAKSMSANTYYSGATPLDQIFTPQGGYDARPLEGRGIGKGTGFATQAFLDGVKEVTLFDKTSEEKVLMSTVSAQNTDLTGVVRLVATTFNTDIPTVTTDDTAYWELEVRYYGDADPAGKAADETLAATTTFTGSTENIRQQNIEFDLNTSLISERDIIGFVLKRIPTNPADNYSADAAISSMWFVYKKKYVASV